MMGEAGLKERVVVECAMASDSQNVVSFELRTAIASGVSREKSSTERTRYYRISGGSCANSECVRGLERGEEGVKGK